MSLIEIVTSKVRQPQELDSKEKAHRDLLTNVIVASLSASLGFGPVATRDFAITKTGAVILGACVPPQYIPSQVWSHYDMLIKDPSLSDAYVLYHIVYFQYSHGILNTELGFVAGESLFSNLKSAPKVGRFIRYSFAQQFCDHTDEDKIKQCICVIFSGINADELALTMNSSRIAALKKIAIGSGGDEDPQGEKQENPPRRHVRSSSSKKRKNDKVATKEEAMEEASRGSDTSGSSSSGTASSAAASVYSFFRGVFSRNKATGAMDTMATSRQMVDGLRKDYQFTPPKGRSINDRLRAGESMADIQASMTDASLTSGDSVDAMDDDDFAVPTGVYHSSGQPATAQAALSNGVAHTYEYDQDSMME
jgi:hypothetical protein